MSFKNMVVDIQKRKLKILNELRPTGEGFAGIPQETRLVNSIIANIEEVELTGLLNANTRQLPRNTANYSVDPVYRKARDVVSLDEGPYTRRWHKLRGVFGASTSLLTAKFKALVSSPIQVKRIDLSAYSDFVWRKYFAKSLGLADFNATTSSKFAVISTPWNTMNWLGDLPPGRGQYLNVDTRGYDVFLSQTPFPGKVSKGTRHVIRYHDAIPMTFPHTIHNAVRHQSSHYFALKSNLANGGSVVCNSNNSKSELLSMFPEKQSKVDVIPCVVSSIYQTGQKIPDARVREIVRESVEPSTAPSFTNLRQEQDFYDEFLLKRSDTERMQYLLMVSTIEPRKNHARLLSAWASLRANKYPNLKCIVVGRPGWSCETILQSMLPHQNLGRLFNISRVSASDLCELYRAASVVVCPSLAEGFDLSGIEAMLSGANVAASDIPVHREIYQNGSSYFSPYSTSQAIEAIDFFLDKSSANEARKTRDRGVQLAKDYTYQRIAQQWQDYFGEMRKELNLE